MDKTNLLKYFTVNKKEAGTEFKTRHVFDNFAKRDKKLTIVPADKYTEFSLNHFIKLFNIFSESENPFLEFLIGWGILDDQSLYILRDARDISTIPDELCNAGQIPYILLDTLIGLYNIHRNNCYYGGVKRDDLLYKYNRRHNIDSFSYYLSGAKILKAEISSDVFHLQKEDVKSLVYSLISFLIAKENAGLAKIKSPDIKQAIDYFIKDRIIRDIITETFQADESISYYIRLLIKNLFYSNEVQRQFYNSIMDQIPSPDIPIERHSISQDIIKSHNAIVITGPAGIGKSFYVKTLLNRFRKMKYTPFVINAALHGTSNYDFIKNFTDLLSSILRKNDSLIFERSNNAPEDLSVEERMYLLYRFDQTVKPVFVLENIDHADENTLLLFKAILEAGIYVLITKNSDIHSDHYVRILKNLDKKSIYSISLTEWSVNDISTLLEMVLYNENKKKIRIFSELLYKNSVRDPKKIQDAVNYIMNRESDIFGCSTEDFKNNIIINIDLFRKFKENMLRDLLPDEYSLLKTIYLFPCSMDSLFRIHPEIRKEISEILNQLLSKKLISLESNKYFIKDPGISEGISAMIGRNELHDEYRRIGDYLLRDDSDSGKIPVLVLVNYLLNGGYFIESARMILDHSGKPGNMIQNGRVIWYYNKACEIFRRNNMINEQIIMMERLFEIHHRRSDYSKANSILHSLSKTGYDPFNLHKKYALLLESTGEYKKAIEYYNKAFSLIKNRNDIYLKIDIYIDIARLLIKTYKIKAAEEILQKAVLLEKDNNMMDKHNIILSLFGELHTLKNDLEAARKASVESAELSEQARDYYILTQTLSNLGLIYFKQKAFDKAYVYYKKALDLSIKCDNIHGISMGYFNLGRINTVAGNFPKASEQFTSAMVFHQKTGNRKEYVNDIFMISYLLTEKGELSKAYYMIKEGLDIAEKIQDPELKSLMLYSFGRIYHYLGSYGESINYYFYSREIAKKIGLKAMLPKIYNSLSCLMFDLGDYTRAGQFAQKSIILDKDLKSSELMPLNNAVITASRIFSDNADDPLGLIRELKNEESLPDNFYRFRYFKIIYDTGRYIGVKDLMIYCLQVMKDLSLNNYSVWYDQVQCLSHQLLHNDLPLEIIRKNLSAAEQMDFSELQWVWEYMLANSLYSNNEHQESYRHYIAVYEKIKDRLYSISESYRKAYISNPFRKFAYDKGKKISDKFNSLYY